MKKALIAATAAFAALTVAPAANASVSLTCPQISGSASCTFDESAGTGFYGNSVTSDFVDTFYITLTDSYRLSITLTNTLDVNGPVLFNLVELLNSSSVSLGTLAGGAVPNSFNVGPGVYALQLTGGLAEGATRGSYSGTIDIAAVPEPASWAMMIAGIAAVGVSMRRRNQTARVAFS